MFCQKEISEKFRRQRNVWKDPKTHWLDNIAEKEGEKLVAEIKHVSRILILYLPIPIYWSVYQNGHRWISQSTRMNGDLGFATINPNYINAAHPFLGVLAVPVCTYILFPLLAKIRVTSFLQKMTIGGMLAVMSSVIASVVEIYIGKSYISVLWLIPQYVIATFSENLVYNPHLCFSYTEAPESMKAIMTSFVFACRAFGYTFSIMVNKSGVFKSLTTEFFFLAWFLLVAIIIFVYLASKYKSINQDIIISSKDKESEA